MAQMKWNGDFTKTKSYSTRDNTIKLYRSFQQHMYANIYKNYDYNRMELHYIANSFIP
jgi:hypothetical protein